MKETVAAIGLIGAVIGGVFILALLRVANSDIGTPAYTSTAISPRHLDRHDLGRGFDG